MQEGPCQKMPFACTECGFFIKNYNHSTWSLKMLYTWASLNDGHMYTMFYDEIKWLQFLLMKSHSVHANGIFDICPLSRYLQSTFVFGRWLYWTIHRRGIVHYSLALGDIISLTVRTWEQKWLTYSELGSRGCEGLLDDVTLRMCSEVSPVWWSRLVAH